MFRLGFIVFSMIFAASTQLSSAEPESAVASVDPTISRVETGGRWEGVGRSGFYRALVQTRCSPEHCHDRLFLQWIAEAEPDRTGTHPYAGKVMATSPVREIGDLTNISDMHFVFGGTATRLEVSHSVERDPELRLVRCFTLGLDGRYTQREAPCARSKP
jgi:hypothetical protein